MVDTSMRDEAWWEKVYDGYNWTYTPGRMPPPVKEQWELCECDPVYEIKGYANGVHYHVITDLAPEIEGPFFTFILKKNKYYIPEHLMDTFEVTRLVRNTYYKLLKGENDACPRLFPDEREGAGKCVVAFHRILAIDEADADE